LYKIILHGSIDIRKNKSFISLKIKFCLIRYQEEDIQWSSLLKQQEEYYQTQLITLQSILMTTHNALKNVRFFY
jgi:hypothetical protein